jgi:DNA-binding LacI/PurR family transcriptional regulator/DNA-binding transcriptional regulator YhcF (GntR family)
MMAEKLSRSLPVSRNAAGQVRDALERLCDELGPGGRIPVRAELMRRFDASERSVLRALDDLHRMGRIDRRVGAGTFVRSAQPIPAISAPVGRTVEPQTVVAIAEPDNSFFAYGMQQLYRYAETARLSLIGRMVDSQALDRLDLAQLGAPLGFIILRRSLAPLAEQLQAMGQRVVMIGSMHAGVEAGFPCIHGDHEHGAYLATNHLIESGHRRIAFALGGDDIRQSLRWLGHQQAITEARRSGLTIHETILDWDDYNRFVADTTETAAFFRRADAPTGIVAWNDHEALRLLTVLLNAGIRVPTDVSLIGYDNLPEGERVAPRLTTIDQSLGTQLRIALRLLAQSAPLTPHQQVLTVPTLILRASTASVPGSRAAI